MNDFFNEIEAGWNRIRSLRESENESPEAQLDILNAAFEELLNNHQALRVVEQQLRAQSKALSDSYEVLEQERARYRKLFEFAPDTYIVTNARGQILDTNRAASTLLNRNAEYLYQKPLIIFFAMKDRPMVRSYLQQLCTSEQVLTWEAEVWPSRQAPSFIANIRAAGQYDSTYGAPLVHWLIRDISEQKQAEAIIRQAQEELELRILERTAALAAANEALQAEIAEREQAERTEREQRRLAEALRDTAIDLTFAPSLTEALDTILLHLQAVVPYDAAVIFLIEEEIAYLAHTHPSDTYTIRKGTRIEIASSPLFKKLVGARRPMTVEHFKKHAAWFKPFGVLDWARSYVGTPILVRNELIGILNLFSSQPDTFRAVSPETLRAFAQQAGNAIHSARLQEKSRQVAVLEERQRIARDLHDAVSQALFTSNLIADTLPTIAAAQPDELDKHLSVLSRLNRAALAEMRALLFELRPSHLLDIDLVAQIQQIIDATKGRKELVIVYSPEVNAPAPQEVQTAIYRIAQEAFNNIVKHSGATCVNVTLRSSADSLYLCIDDNGTGFDPDADNNGMGLNNMRERAAGIGVAFSIESAAGKGTRVIAHWKC